MCTKCRYHSLSLPQSLSLVHGPYSPIALDRLNIRQDYSTPIMASNPSQLFLLADHIKLSLLERTRASKLNIPSHTKDLQISRSIDTLRSGVAALKDEIALLELGTKTDDPPSDTLQTLKDQSSSLSSQLQALDSQFQADPELGPSTTVATPNNRSLSLTFARTKSVRFSDAPPRDDEAELATRAKLFPARYTDEPDAAFEGERAPNQAQLSNKQIHEYHTDVVERQDQDLERLGQSVGRQHELSLQIGDELEGQVRLLDEVDVVVDRSERGLRGAKNRLKGVAKKASDNIGFTTILILIVILVLLLVLFD